MSEEFKGTILVVDDDPSLLDTIKDILEIENFRVELAHSGLEGLEKIKNNIDLVLTDIKMPGMDGIQFLHSIKEMNSDIPVIVITGFASLETAVRAMREGAQDSIVKPFEVDKFIAGVKRAVKEKRLTQKNKELLNDLDFANHELDRRMHQLFRLDEINKTISSTFDLGDILSSLVYTTTEAVKAKVGSFMLLDEESHNLVIKAARGLDKNVIDKVKIKVGQGIPGMVVEKGRTITSSEINKDKFRLGEAEEKIYRSHNFVSIPIASRSRIWGVLNISDPDVNFVFSEVDIKLLEILASQVSIALENSQLNGRLQNSYLNTLQVLASAIEAKCKYTRGHSERVTRYAVQFAKILGLSAREIDKLKFACGVHDIGKINISDAILNKPSRFNEEEWCQMRQHPAKGVEILVPLGILKEIVPLVKHHHERFDGKGYPDGLRGEELPLETKVISLVDSYDAMTSTRPYRIEMNHKSAVKEIEDNLGTQFDVELGKLFVEHRFEEVGATA